MMTVPKEVCLSERLFDIKVLWHFEPMSARHFYLQELIIVAYGIEDTLDTCPMRN